MYDVPIEMSGWVWRSLHIMSYPKDGAPYLDECIIYCVNLYLLIQVRFNPKWLGGDLLPCGFSKNVSSEEMEKFFCDS